MLYAMWYIITDYSTVIIFTYAHPRAHTPVKLSYTHVLALFK